PAKALRATPLGDQLVLETGLAAIAGAELGADAVPDVLALSFSANDYAGHDWGQESWERLDILLELDRILAGFLDELDRRIGREHYAVVLTSDHGATRMVEHSRAAGKSAYRVKIAELLEAANRAARAVLGPGTWARDGSAGTLYMSPQFARFDEAKRSAALDAMVAALAKVPGVGHVARTDQVAGNCEQRSGVQAYLCRSLVLGMSGQIAVSPAENSLITTTYDFGTTHGSLNPDDRLVPLIVMAPGLAPARKNERVSVLRVAPTVAALLGIAPPPAATAASLVP
ncbi:MAG: alkaline phosphatase family protein, partial [Myxococcota bacterium]